MILPPIPQLAAITLGALGVVALVRLLTREHRRINDELEMARAEAVTDRERMRKLKRDPRTGVYRP
jgi:hypothetical protein